MSQDRQQRRRRGETLEHAIVAATWEELREHGYRRTTMSGVARRAGTSKPVVYRRWHSQPELVLAALQQFSLTVEAPDTGSTRDDLVAFLERILGVIELLPADAVRGLLADSSNDPDLFDNVRAHLAGSRVHELTTKILRRGVERGEIPSRPWPDRVLRLPIDVLRGEYLLSREHIPPHVVAEIVDEVFLPLITAPEHQKPKR